MFTERHNYGSSSWMEDKYRYHLYDLHSPWGRKSQTFLNPCGATRMYRTVVLFPWQLTRTP